MQSTRYSCQILVKLEYSWQIFEKYSNINFHESLSGARRVVPCGQTATQTDRETDMTKLIVAFRTRVKIKEDQLAGLCAKYGWSSHVKRIMNEEIYRRKKGGSARKWWREDFRMMTIRGWRVKIQVRADCKRNWREAKVHSGLYSPEWL